MREAEKNKPLPLHPFFFCRNTNMEHVDSMQLGDWTKRVTELARVYHEAQPFSHVIIDEFLPPRVYAQLEEAMEGLSPDISWYRYFNPLEVKWAWDKLDHMPPIVQAYFALMQSSTVVELMRQLTGVATLEHDPYLHGAGVHLYPHGGRLRMHLDYELHPVTNHERRANVIFFVNRRWDETWGGHTEFWRDSKLPSEVQVPVKRNRAVIFRTNDHSLHGVPRPLTCPHGMYRRSLAYYYVAPLPESEAQRMNKRPKAQFFPAPNSRLAPDLFRIRTHRRLSSDDVARFAPSSWFSDN